MAQFKPRPDYKRKESIADLMHDLKLLSPHGYEAVSSMATGRKLREQRLEELKRNHGTLPEVRPMLT